MAFKAAPVILGGAGFLLLWSGVTNQGVAKNLSAIFAGNPPIPGPKQSLLSFGSNSSNSSSSNTTSGSVSLATYYGTPSGTDAQNQALGQRMAAAYGWSSGDEWTALNNVVMSESGWNAYSANPDSDARGIAQNINGWSSNYEPGNAVQQISWLLSYIKSRYGDPITAWKFHIANNWY